MLEEEETKWELIITADRDPTVLGRVGDILTTFATIPTEFHFSDQIEERSISISLQLHLPEKRLDLLRRQMLRMTLVHDVRLCSDK